MKFFSQEELMSLLACPKCKALLVQVIEDPSYRENAISIPYLDCANCRLRYPIENEIPMMSLDRALPY